MRYKNYLTESSLDNATDFASTLENKIRKIFPKSGVKVEYSTNLYASITVHFTLGKDRSEYQSGIVHNDPVHTMITIDGDKKDSLSILGDIVHKVDYQMKQLILFHNEALYFLPFNMRQPAMRIEMNNLPKDAVEFIINNIVLKNTLKVRKPYISKVDKNLVRRFPLMNYILMYMLSIYKNPKDLFDNIAVFSYSNRKILDLSVQNKINLLMVNLK